MSALRCRAGAHSWSANEPSDSQRRQKVGGAVDRLVRLLVGGRRRRPRPGERDEGLLAGAHGDPGPGPPALEAEPQVAGETDGRVGLVGDADDGPVVVPGVGPRERVAAVAEHGLAVHGDDGRPADAMQGPHQHRLRLVVRRHAAEHRRALRRVAPAPDEQRVADDEPTAVGPPRRLHHHGAGQVAPPGRDHLVGGPDAGTRPHRDRGWRRRWTASRGAARTSTRCSRSGRSSALTSQSEMKA